jgi:hypothetical protein
MGGNDASSSQASLFSESNKDKTVFNDVLKSNSEEFNAFSLNIGNMAKEVEGVMGKMFDAMNPLNTDAFKQLDQYGTQVQRSFGLSKSRIDEFKDTIANAGPELTKLGITEDAMANKLIEVMQGLGGAASVSKEAVIELTAASELTGQNVGTLASNFREVGISVYDVGENIKDVANYARSVGASVNGVTQGVVDNLSKMNLYNFDNGVKGLAKMAATSERLGITMDQVFQQADKLMDPENAIEMSAALQRLGVTSSGLLDPLRAMDMAQNDPEALQKEMVKLGAEFTRFNERTGKMEILPGAKRRMKEVAESVGMTADEFGKMAIKSADFEMKLKQIKMPSLAEGDEETKEMIATMAQMKGGVATIQVRDKETGITTEKKVEELTPDDIENLKNANEDASKSIEEIAFSQLDTTTQILNLLKTGEVSSKFAKATSPTLERFFGVVTESKLAIAKSADKVFGSTEEMRRQGESISQPIENLIKARLSGDEAGFEKSKEEIVPAIFKVIGDFEGKVTKEVENVQNTIVDKLKTTYLQPLKVEAKSEGKLDFNLNLKSEGTNLTFTPEEISKIKQKMLDDPEFAKKLVAAANGSLVSATTGGKNQ